MRALLLGVIDLLMVPLLLPCALFLKLVRRIGLLRLPNCSRGLDAVGLLPIRKHYYEPLLVPRDLRHALDQERYLPGIDWNVAEQLDLLRTLTYEGELSHWAGRSAKSGRGAPRQFGFNNGSFESGDAEYLYQTIRSRKPRRIVEIGCGYSTLIMQEGIKMNASQDENYSCKHICIEPFEAPWLVGCDVSLMRSRVERVERSIFQELKKDDLLFIDSSHVIRPQGDVLTEYLEILPILRPGVIVHVHDIFSPRDYLSEWIIERRLLWNEQYLLECLLSTTNKWKIIGAINLLSHRYFDELSRVCPYLSTAREPGSFYIQKQADGALGFAN